MIELIKRNKTKLISHFSDFFTSFLDFAKFTRKRKGRVYYYFFAEKTMERTQSLQLGPWPGQRGGEGLTGRFCGADRQRRGLRDQ